LLAVAAYGVWKWRGEALAVPVVEAAPRTLRSYVDERGVTRLPRQYEITMPFDGRVETIALEEGDRVTSGQTVARVVGADVQLDVALMAAATERLLAALAENADVGLEMTAKRQAEKIIESMAANLSASRQQVDISKIWAGYWRKYLDRMQWLQSRLAVTEDELERGEANLQSTEAEIAQREQAALAQSLMNDAMQLIPQLIVDYLHRRKLQGDVLRKQLDEAQLQLQQAELREQRASMTSPIDGVVLTRQTDNEQFLRAGSSLLTIGQLQRLEIEADILTQDAAAISPGLEVEIYGPAVGREAGQGWRGEVRRVLPNAFTKVSSLGVEEQRVKVIVAVNDVQGLLYERPGLGVGFRVRLRIFTDQHNDALTIPRSALFHNDDGSWGVFVVRQGRAERQTVELGLTNDQWAEIVTGLQAGELVLVAPESAVEHGTRVRPLTE
jgi:HlyD family secretion protein